VILASRLRILGLLAAAGAAAVASCSTTTATTTYTPITGIEIRSASLVAGFGCGEGPTQVYRYAAAVSYASGSEPDAATGGGARDAGHTPDAEAGATLAEAGLAPVVAPVETRVPVEQNRVPLTNIFDCFADGVFENLPSSDAGSLTFNVTIFAYNKEKYDEARLPPDPGCPPGVDAGGCTPTSQPLTAAQEALAPWTTLCTATQQAGTPVIAVCGPLVPAMPFESGDAAADGPVEAPDGAADVSSEGATDAAPDATNTPGSATDGGAAAPDAGDASTPG